MKIQIVAMGLLLLTYVVHAQLVPNGNFENWTAASNYDDPTGWDTPNSATASLGIKTVTKESSIVQNGSFAVKLKSGSIFGTPIPGLITLGDFNINIVTFQATITGGTPFTLKPDKMNGFFQYEPVFNDEAFIGVILLKQNGTQWDTIADGNFTTTSNIVTWTPFSITINYRSTDTPTHLNIIILSSDRNAPQPNSTLYVDNLVFTYPASVEEIQSEYADIFVYDNILHIISKHNSVFASSVEVYSVDGRLLKSVNYDQGHVLPELSIPLVLPSAMYLAVVRLSNGVAVNHKFIIQ